MRLYKRLTKVLSCLLASIILLSSCSFGKFMEETATDVKYVQTSNAHENKFRTDGYYVAENDSLRFCYGLCFFYPDGGFIGITANMIHFFKHDSMDDVYKRHGYSQKKQRWNWEFGVYQMNNDTILANQYKPHYMLVKPLYFYWWMDRSKWVVIDEETLELQAYEDFVGAKDDFSFIRRELEKPVRFHFVHADQLPSSDMKYKKKRWMWESKSDWKKYMKNR